MVNLTDNYSLDFSLDTNFFYLQVNFIIVDGEFCFLFLFFCLNPNYAH